MFARCGREKQIIQTTFPVPSAAVPIAATAQCTNPHFAVADAPTLLLYARASGVSGPLSDGWQA